MNPWWLIASGSIVLLICSLRQLMHRRCILKMPCSYQRPNRRITIEIVETITQCNAAVDTLKRHCGTYNVVGFDCEWIQNGSVALLQIATNQGYCVLFRLCRFRQIPSSLRELLEDPRLIKVGVTPLKDAQKLYSDFNVSVLGTLDLRYLAALLNYPLAGLAGLAQSVLNVYLKNNSKIIISNWEASKLTDDQIAYAANDALIAIELYKEMEYEFKESNHRKLIEILQYKLDLLFK